MLDETKIEEMQSHLSHLIDKLSAISSNAEIINLIAGDVYRETRQGKVVVGKLKGNIDEGITQSYDIINQMRKMLTE
ncbi:hypothetical protein [Clavibacter sp.]|uniref:hypothetical protein n=1 Tax=Clavibacter sp. TaxID=1871044 RepID=UPI0019CF499C|nr:hypothetical protein [Clavibacter sp.]MBD5381906.1 hypothetical protein [Clavibacter sp.]